MELANVINNYFTSITNNLELKLDVLTNTNLIYNHGQQLYGQLRKTALSLTPQAMYNQLKRPSTGSVRELYYIYRKI